MVPSNASADRPTVSDRVGCGWMVSAMSAASAPISIAWAISAMSSPALGPARPAPISRSLAWSNSSLVRPSSRASDSDRPLAGRHFGGDPALVGGLVGEHRRPGDVADGEDVRHVGALLLVDGDVAALID